MTQKKQNIVPAKGQGQSKGKETTQSLKAALKREQEAYKNLVKKFKVLQDEIDKEAEVRSRKRIMEKDKEVALYEQELEDRVANKELVIKGQLSKIDLLMKKNAEQSSRILELEKELKKAKRRREGVFAKLFGYKGE